MSSGESKMAVYAAIVANGLVMIAKFVGWGFTGSGAMLSEAIHSVADLGNQVLLAIGLRNSQRPADEVHPFGYGREAFVWALMSAVGLFFLGCGVTVAHGLEARFGHGPHEISDSGLAIGILVGSLVLEGTSLVIAARGLLREARERGVSFAENLRTTDDPFRTAVVLEDSSAVLGVLLALGALLLTRYTGNTYWDAYGTLAIGALLGVVASFLISRNRALLLGRAVRPEDQQALTELLEADPAIERVVLQRVVVAGVDDYRISAEIDFDGAWIAQQWLHDQDAGAIALRLSDGEALEAFLKEYGEAVITQAGLEVDRIEAKIRNRLPRARNIALEPHG